MPETLLQTKLYIPPLRPNLVPRTELIQRLDQGLQLGHKLTLICAPAGFGKTTLVVEWVKQKDEAPSAQPSASSSPPFDSARDRPFKVAWVALDEEDNDPAQLFAYVLAALRGTGVEMGQSTAMLQRPNFPSERLLVGAIVNDVASHSGAIFLVLDDYHKISNRVHHDSIAYLLKHLPPQMHAVIITREDPPFSLSQLRGRGEMIEIRQNDLRFTVNETSIFLNEKMGLSLVAEQVKALETRTEGWIAGLHLASLALQGLVSTRRQEDVDQFVRSFAGSNRFVLDYLMDEVIRRQASDVRAFLLQTAILDRLSGPLCAAVTGREDSQKVIRTLEQANLFVFPLDDTGQWYRYHHLFADLLRYRLQQSGAATDELHERASRWYESNGLAAEAIHHALAAEAWERAANLIEESSERLLKHGQIATLLRWLRPLPEEALKARPALCSSAGWALALSDQLEAAERYANMAEPGAAQSPALMGDALALQAYIARARQDVPRTIELSQKVLSLLPPEDSNSRSVVGTNLGVAHIYSGALATAMTVFSEAAQNGRQADNHYALALALSFQGQILAAWGKLHRAAELQRQAIRLGLEKGASPGATRAHVNLAALHYEWDELAPAEEHLQQALELCKLVDDKHVERDACRILALVRQAQGDMAGAQAAIGAAQDLLAGRQAPVNIQLVAAITQVDLALSSGDVATAVRWWDHIEEIAPEPNGLRPDLLTSAGCLSPLLGLARARLLLTLGERTAAADLLASCYRAAVEGKFGYSRVKAGLLQALAAPEPASTARYLSETVTLAQPEGYKRSFVDEGEPMTELLRALEAQDPAARSYIQALLDAPGQQLPAVRPSAAAQSLIEPLSQRELEVLHLLAEQQTNAEIAQTLTLSSNTVKTHLQHIYEKLNVHDRRAAVFKARDLNLLP